ncbi:U3 snoRNP protein [Scheffersomyces xylosifermentans]|uniref:U3 snoRNP protein n=1 Tax=Scheffersomyces xylosifermentans TaxID=1304137 RepID=UPI00315CF193
MRWTKKIGSISSPIVFKHFRRKASLHMAKLARGKTTESTRRHAFSSFRERIDSIKIEPSLDLRKRAHDYVETSHFLSTLDHWKEVNLSGNFSDFVDKVEVYSQTLPQILHHQDTIFEALFSGIEVNDVHSIQPLMDLLAQFIHDLGDDFMPYYPRFLSLLMKIALDTNPNDSQNNRNTSNALEWTFNCLAFAFKYLSRSLSSDLRPTFELFLPILQMTKKTYISRFCAEALSFLIRKLRPEALTSIIMYSFEQINTIEDEIHYCETLSILYSESIKNTKGTFHSKSHLILTKILKVAFESSGQGQNKKISVVSDVILDLINHGSIDACNQLYAMTVEFVKNELAGGRNLLACIQIMTVLSFAESGKRISDWDLMLDLFNSLVDNISKFPKIEVEEIEVSESLIYLLVIILRNGQIQMLTKLHLSLFNIATTFNDGKYFISFAESCMDLTKERAMKFGLGTQLQSYVLKMNGDCVTLQRLAYFISKMRKNNNQDILKFLELSDQVNATLLDMLHLQEEQLSSGKLPSDLYWILILLSLKNQYDLTEGTLINILELLCSQYNVLPQYFCNDLIAAVMDAFSGSSMSSNHTEVVLSAVLALFPKLQESSNVIRAFHRFTSLNKEETKAILEENKEFFIEIVKNLQLPSHDSRMSAIELLYALHEAMELEISPYLSHIRVIEQIPLSISTGRDIQQRVRTLALEFKKDGNSTEFDCQIITYFFFGLLSNRFQPCWEAVYESLPNLIPSCSKLIWDCSLHFIQLNYSQIDSDYITSDEVFLVETGELLQWQAINSRLRDNFVGFHDRYFAPYVNIKASIFEFAKSSRADNTYSEIMRSHAIKALCSVPTIAEAHSESLVPLVLRSEVEEEDFVPEGKPMNDIWTLKDRNDLLGLFLKFKNLRKVYQADSLYSHLLLLLSNKHLEAQKLALSVLLRWGNASVNKYSDNLRNLLDDNIFRDELSNLTKTADSIIEDKERENLMPFILRILFGRVQGSPKSNSKVGRKFAVVMVLPSLSHANIIEFIKLGSERIGYHDYFNHGTIPQIDRFIIRRISGFINLLAEIYETLGSQYNDVHKTTIEPLIYSLVVSQECIDLQQNSINEDDSTLEKAAKNIRQTGMRCLSNLFKILDGNYDWKQHSEIIYDNIIKPRMANFVTENLQQPSSLLKVITSWIDQPNTIALLYIDDYSPASAVLSLLGNDKAKDSVLYTVLEFARRVLNRKSEEDDQYFTLVAIVVDSILENLPRIIDGINNREVGSMSVQVLLLLIEGKFITDESAKESLLRSLTSAIDKPQSQIETKDKVHILESLSSLVASFDCSFNDIVPLYETCSKLLRVYPDRNIRGMLVTVLRSIGIKFGELNEISELVGDLNAYSAKRIQEYDFERRLNAFRVINEELYMALSPVQWLPVVYCALFFINDPNEFAIRTNATFTLRRFVDCFSAKDAHDADPYIRVLKTIILPQLRIGIRKDNEDVQTEYIAVLEHLVDSSKHYCELSDMKALTFNNDDESNFFKNINHIQLHRRQRAVKRLAEYRGQLSENSIAHYLLPMIEHYAMSQEEKFTNIRLESLETISMLVRRVSWSQFKAIFRRYIANLRSSNDVGLKSNVNMVIALSKSLMYSFQNNKESAGDVIKDLPTIQQEIDTYVLQELFPPLLKVLVVRNDETIVARSPLSEALSYLIMCLREDLIESELPTILTSTCQVMRSRSEELRDAVRKSLGNIVKLLGPKYLRFVLKELKTALSRGSQIHVLSFTTHYLLMSISSSLNHGDLDDSLDTVVHIVMEDIFGAAGQEKDAEGYTSKMKEVKFKKCFDVGEILSTNISLTSFSYLINPIKMLLRENINMKTQNKLDELLRRYALGLNHNDEASSTDILLLCYEIHQSSKEMGGIKPVKQVSKTESHFLVDLDAKPSKAQLNNSIFVHTLQKFSFELLRTAISRHEQLLTVPNLEGFVPLLEDGLNSESEGVVVSCLRILNTVIRLPFSDKEEAIFTSSTRKSLTIIKDSPSTNSEMCQAALRFLATAIRHKPEIKIKDSAIKYILERIQPDLEQPNRQGLAFNFLRALVSQHIMIPELYDIMDKVSKIMVVNHSKEIRDMSRSVYFIFLMEYDQGRGRLEKQFKFLVNNLAYPTEAGRQSVMELIHLIVSKAGSDLLIKIASSFFVALANVVVSDDAPKCREMATSLVSTIFRRLGSSRLDNIEKYCLAWLTQSSNSLLKRCGFSIYKIYISELGFSINEVLDNAAIENIKRILASSQNNSANEDSVEWELLYSALSVFSIICGKLQKGAFDKTYSRIWTSIIDVLLFPHSWVRLISCRLIGLLLSNLDSIQLEFTVYQVQTIAYRLLHQLAAPSITEELGDQIVKNLVSIAIRWERDSTPYQHSSDIQLSEGDKYTFASEYLVSRISSILRQESSHKLSFVSKKSAIKLSAMLVQIAGESRVSRVAESLLIGLYNFTELDPRTENEETLVNLTLECLKLIEEKLGTSDYSAAYAKVKSQVNSRRQERKTKRAQLAVNAPDIAAKRKLRKHERSREKRKHEKDENGYYRSKKRK